MTQWRFQIVAKKREPIDKHLLVAAILALGRQLWATEKAESKEPGRDTSAPEGLA